MSDELRDIEDHRMVDIISNSIQDMNELPEHGHILLIDDKEIHDENELNDVIKNFYNGELFQENTKIHLKLKINLREYIIISNVLYPSILKVVD